MRGDNFGAPYLGLRPSAFPQANILRPYRTLVSGSLRSQSPAGVAIISCISIFPSC